MFALSRYNMKDSAVVTLFLWENIDVFLTAFFFLFLRDFAPFSFPLPLAFRPAKEAMINSKNIVAGSIDHCKSCSDEQKGKSVVSNDSQL